MAKTGDDRFPSFYTVREIAERLRVHPETVRRLIHHGELEAVRIGRVLRIRRESLERFLVERHLGRHDV